MSSRTLDALEKAVEPYHHAGFIVVSQSEDALTLAYLSERFNYLLFVIFLLVFWPIAIFYLISFNNRRGRIVTIRITTEGYIEESGYTLDLIARRHRQEHWIGLIIIGILVLLTLSALAFLLIPQPGIL